MVGICLYTFAQVQTVSRGVSGELCSPVDNRSVQVQQLEQCTALAGDIDNEKPACGGHSFMRILYFLLHFGRNLTFV